ncbi:MAG: HAMP domain-containing sensor histidine kinase [Nakamurella sp.]
MSRTRLGMAARIAVLGVCVAVITGALAGVLAAGLIRHAAQSGARQELARLAVAAAGVSDSQAAQLRIDRTLAALAVRYGYIGPQGTLLTRSQLVRAATRPEQLTQVQAGQPVSASETVEGIGVYLEARPVSGGGAVVLVQRHGDANAAGVQAIWRTVLAILIGVVVAAVAGVLMAWRMAQPLRRTAAAAHALASGRRDVVLALDGPAEVSAVAEAVNGLASALAHSEMRQREFLLSVSHDLRTPLTAIFGYAESIADGVVPAEESAAAASVIVTEAQRLTRLVTDLLDLARLDAHDFRIELAEVDLDDLARHAAQVWQHRCGGVGVEFQLQPAGVPLWASTDAARVRQILDGLLENALRVTPAGAPIVLALRVEPAAAVVEVRDGGPGLSDEDLSVAFQRAELYRRYQGVRQVGTGLGLAIVAGLTARLGGTVEAGHAIEGGARFTLRLPRQR